MHDNMEAGERFPDYVLIDDSGNEFDSRSMAGKRYVLYFYPKDNTSTLPPDRWQT